MGSADAPAVALQHQAAAANTACGVCRLAAGLAAAGGLTLLPAPGLTQSSMLDGVKRDPARARSLCRQFRELNKQGVSYTSRQALQQVAGQEGLNLMDAEVLSTYVVGLYCPDVN
jgi:triphosphoribosyl-dephospho-CoA synthetase